MRSYLNIACLFGLGMAVGCGPSSEYPTASNTTTASTAAAPPATPPEESTQWMQLVIPTMKSVKEDWSKVETALKAQAGVKEVRYKPTEDDVIPDSIVLIKHTAAFDSKKVTEVLGEVGYKDATVKGF